MAVLITEIIPQQGFEIVLNRLGAILFEEVSNQKNEQSFTDDVSFWIERQQPYDKAEDVVIVVSCNNIAYNGQTQHGAQGDTNYFVDVYARGHESEATTGNDDTRFKMHRYLGIIRYILNSTKYKTLAFPPALVGGVNVQTIQFDDNYGRQDGAFIRFARLSVSVRINESQELWNTDPFEGMDTTIKLDLTEKGYKLIFNNI